MWERSRDGCRRVRRFLDGVIIRRIGCGMGWDGLGIDVVEND